MFILRPPSILLTFDVEEFDLPLEFNQQISQDDQMETGKHGLEIVRAMLSDNDIACTMFTTGLFAKTFPETVALLSEQHEIASHSLNHSAFKKSDLLESRLILEKVSGKEVKGFRMPRMQKIDMKWLCEAGYSYDSSVNPTLMPGRYNNLNLPRTVYKDQNILRIPSSVTPNLRIPLFWLSFKNFPYSLFVKLALQTLRRDGYLVLYFHPWEFTKLNNYALPFYIKKNSGTGMQENLNRLIIDLKLNGKFETISSFLRNRVNGSTEINSVSTCIT